jgi:hypothetical protein
MQIIGWFVFACAVVAIWYGLEKLGLLSLGAQVFSRMAPWMRIIVGIPIVLSLVALGGGALWLAGNVIAWLTGANAI